MEPQSIEKTAFCPGPGYGLWEFTRMPYGLTGATQTCQRGLDNILQNCKDCVDNYVDDCIVFSDNMTTHISDLQKVLGRLLAAGLTLRGSKCFFGKTKTTHLGYEYSANGVAPSPEKTKSISTWTAPKTTKELRCFLGLVNFYHHFVPNFADMAVPLTELTGKNIQFKWEYKAATQQQRKSVWQLYGRPTSYNILSKGSTLLLKLITNPWNGCSPRDLVMHNPKSWKGGPWNYMDLTFEIVHRQSSHNQHADALSHRPVTTVTINSDLDSKAIAAAQKSEPVLDIVLKHLASKEAPSFTGSCRKFHLKLISPNMVLVDSQSICTLLQSKLSNHARTETTLCCTHFSTKTFPEESS